MRLTLPLLALALLCPLSRAADQTKSTMTPEQVALAKKVTDLLPERTAKKDVSPGQQVFTKAQCAACHTVDGGDKVGPTLQGIGRRGDAKYIIESILGLKTLVCFRDALPKNRPRYSRPACEVLD